MPFFDGFEMLGFALDAEAEDRQFLRWVVLYQTEMGFEEFKQAVSGGAGRRTEGRMVPEDGRTVADVLKMVKGIIG